MEKKQKYTTKEREAYERGKRDGKSELLELGAILAGGLVKGFLAKPTKFVDPDKKVCGVMTDCGRYPSGQQAKRPCCLIAGHTGNHQA